MQNHPNYAKIQREIGRVTRETRDIFLSEVISPLQVVTISPPDSGGMGNFRGRRTGFSATAVPFPPCCFGRREVGRVIVVVVCSC